MYLVATIVSNSNSRNFRTLETDFFLFEWNLKYRVINDSHLGG